MYQAAICVAGIGINGIIYTCAECKKIWGRDTYGMH